MSRWIELPLEISGARSFSFPFPLRNSEFSVQRLHFIACASSSFESESNFLNSSEATKIPATSFVFLMATRKRKRTEAVIASLPLSLSLSSVQFVLQNICTKGKESVLEYDHVAV